MTTYTPKQVAKILNISLDRVYQKARARKVGTRLDDRTRSWVFTDADVVALSVKGKPGRPPRAEATATGH